MKMTLEDLKRDGTYRYVETLCTLMDQAGIKGEAMELPIEVVLQAPIPSYLPLSAAVKTKLLFVLAIYSSAGRFGALLDAMAGINNMICLVSEEREKKR